MTRIGGVLHNEFADPVTHKPLPGNSFEVDMQYQELSPEKLLGHLNEVEQKNAPKALFVRGDTEILKRGPRVSVIGSRKATQDALDRAGKLAECLVREGAVVVSGLAKGIDTMAHRVAMATGGRTIAVIGTSLAEAYPKENSGLQEQIATEHLLISQFPVGAPTQRGNFVRRNRTMALISDASVIVEAGGTSGSLSQGWEALRLKRQLFLLKSVVENPDLSWPEEMMEYGALILSDDNIDNLMEVLPSRNIDEPTELIF